MTDNANELKNTGLKATAPRLKIMQVFQRADQRHLSAEDVYRQLLEDHSDIGLSTVYRVLAQFEQAGILNRRHFGSATAVYELREDEDHDHLICLDCGHVEEFYDPEIERRQDEIAESRGFVIAEHAHSLYVHCIRKDCPHRAEKNGASGVEPK